MEVGGSAGFSEKTGHEKIGKKEFRGGDSKRTRGFYWSHIAS